MPDITRSSIALPLRLVGRVVGRGALAQDGLRVVDGPCVESILGGVIDSFGARVLPAISCGPAGGRLGLCPGCLSFGVDVEGYHVQRIGSAIAFALGAHGGVASLVGCPFSLAFSFQWFRATLLRHGSGLGGLRSVLVMTVVMMMLMNWVLLVVAYVTLGTSI